MKKHDEGYALVLVLVVMVVLCLVALSMMSVSLHNMENQRASIQRMQDQYAAEGAIEAVLAQLENIPALTIETEEVVDALNNKLETYCDSVSEGIVCDMRVEDPIYSQETPSNDFTYTVSLIAKSGQVQVKCNFTLEATLTGTETNFVLNNTKLTYNSYTISVLSEGGEAA